MKTLLLAMGDKLKTALLLLMMHLPQIQRLPQKQLLLLVMGDEMTMALLL
jgi:hypothetical protein